MMSTKKERFLRSVTWIAVAAFVLFVLIMLLFGMHQQAKAHDFWISHGKYKNAEGISCCGDNDCEELSPDDVSISEFGYRIGSLKETVPFNEAQTSEDGKFWRCHKDDGSRRCFFAPQPST